MKNDQNHSPKPNFKLIFELSQLISRKFSKVVQKKHRTVKFGASENEVNTFMKKIWKKAVTWIT